MLKIKLSKESITPRELIFTDNDYSMNIEFENFPLSIMFSLVNSIDVDKLHLTTPHEKEAINKFITEFWNEYRNLERECINAL